MAYKRQFLNFLKKVLPPFVQDITLYIYILIKSSGRHPYRRTISKRPDSLHLEFNDLWNQPNWINHVRKCLSINADPNASPNVNINTIIWSINVLSSFFPGKTIHVYDVGGGVGLYYPFIKRYFNLDIFELLYTVIDSAANIQYGSEFFAQDQQINFILSDQFNSKTCITDSSEVIVINISSTLQYILKWRDYLAWLIQEFDPKSIVITRFPVSNNAEHEGFAIQDVSTPFGYCGSTKVVLFKSGDLEVFLDRYGYKKCAETLCHKPNYFTGGVSDIQFKQISIMAYNFVK